MYKNRILFEFTKQSNTLLQQGMKKESENLELGLARLKEQKDNLKVRAGPSTSE